MTPANRDSHFAPLRGGFRHAALATALVLAVTACGGGDKTAPAAATPTDATPAQTTPAPAQAVSAQVAAMSVDQLRGAARAAQSEQRLYAPSGNNAMEYYLALRDKQPSDAAVQSALTDLLPYTVIATEQSIARDDFNEAQRLFALIEKTDKNAPALPRLKQAITDAQSSFAQRQQQQQVDAETEKARLAKLEEDRKKQQEELQKKAATDLAAAQQKQAEAQRQADAQRAADEKKRQDEAQAAAEKERLNRERLAREQAAASSTSSASSSDLRLISASAPKYPPDAYRDHQAGEVEVEFTVGTDGTVTSARVVRGNPPRIFDREAVAAVKRWRYQPVASPVTTRKTISFKP